MKYLCNDMYYLRRLCLYKMKTYEEALNDLIKGYKNENETDVVAVCEDIADVVDKKKRVESLYYQTKTNDRVLVSGRTILLLRTVKLFDWIKFIGIEEEK